MAFIVLESSRPGEPACGSVSSRWRRTAIIGIVVAVIAGPRLAATAQVEYQVIHSFERSEDRPAAMIQGADGKLYGVTEYGGPNGQGTFFTMAPDGVVTVLHSFNAVTDGVANPSHLIQGSDGDFYSFHFNNVFRLTPAGALQSVYTFPPVALFEFATQLVAAPDGNLYGTTFSPNSPLGGGSVFRLTPSGILTTLRRIGIDADFFGALTIATDGTVYGLTSPGYMSVFGGYTAYKITPSGVMTTLHLFTVDEGHIVGNLVEGADGNFYGFSSHPAGDRLLRMSRDGAVTVLSVRDQTLGFAANLFRGRDGNFYGSTVRGPFRMTYDGVVTHLHAFTGADSGFLFFQALDGTFYGTTSAGGALGFGASFHLSAPITATHGDFDGDGKADITVVRPASGTWYRLESSTSFTNYAAQQWGSSSDVAVPGDYDGDGRMDPAFYRPSVGTWYILQSSTNYSTSIAVPWGLSTDTPVTGDYDGDGKTDLALYRPSSGNWYILQSSSHYASYVAYQWGLSTDIPVPGDYDGDGKTDLALYRPSTGNWYILQSSSHYASYVAYQWGLSTDIPVPGDYDGDGKSDLALYRPSTGSWYILQSSGHQTTYAVYQWGLGADVPIPGDYDGDGKTDLSVYRPATGYWFILQSSTSYSTYVAQQWGLSTDVPLR